MIKKIKSAIQDRLYQNCIEEYENSLRCQSDPYLMWIRETEHALQQEGEEESYPSLSVVYMDMCTEQFDINDLNKDIILFVSREGKIGVNAFREVVQYFDSHNDIDIVYGDEDIWMLPEKEEENPDNEIAHRICPWVKPMWSPDTLFSYLYFGNVFAVRKKAFSDVKWLGMDDWRMNLYDFALQATERGKRAGHIEKILFHTYLPAKNKEEAVYKAMHRTGLIGQGTDYDFIRELAMQRRGIKGKFVVDEKTGYTYPVYDVKDNPQVSIVIPSKDHVDILKQCIRSIYRLTEYKNFEIIVVDNGSTAQARMMLEAFREECEFTYLYQPMEFNFSQMCNLGVKNANGEYILLLNDDMEVIEGSWLTRMLGQATLSHVGAVGAKLLYPNSDLIQHAGITNTIYGPGHKLKQMSDAESYYYGRNKFIYDMIGVTAACLLMKRDIYVKIGGLYEGLKVAFNDVDLCMKVRSKGYLIVWTPYAEAYHYESTSRGPEDTPEKCKRFRKEISAFRKKWKKEIAKGDPYYNRNLTLERADFSDRRRKTYGNN